MTLYLTEQGAVLHKKEGRLVIQKGQREIEEFPLKKIERIMILGNITLTTAMTNYCLDNKIEVIFMTKHGRYRGKLYTDEYRNVLLRLAQYARAQDEKFKTDIAKAIVLGKLKNSYNLLNQKAKKLPKGLLGEEKAAIQAIMNKVKSAKNVDQVRGYEGIAAKYYFLGVKKCIKNDELQFNGRTAHPPKDEINAMLSMGYHFLYVEMLLAMNAVGLDPYFGNLHTLDVSKHALLFDLIEEYRAIIVDNFVINASNLRIFTKSDFEYKENDICYFSKEGMKKFIALFEEHIRQKLPYHLDDETNYIRTIFEKQARHYSRVVLGEEKHYIPYYLKNLDPLS
ncbi:CRISPR-associated endonuclease Cas1 [Fervidobacterium riparium]|uniref:CRISPR-associated endonuclease Cas1 n=1 Tax=Fervidobacterium gondwanense DSM 13020 TaxID=1121883 RepID=A0A1M7TGF9_FERGO|nr:CRISPR-associated endonuclease Cas1 [Fervidobacterium gondwanense]UXF00250.1 CRISPR-associated protein Cas1 [Fervidobacterium riparium]SHN69733.1 CRISP-associated protein Cas1 [Fervidobacterium gondwanense DSM 13020]